jgi:Uma2 family endonuclease
MALPKFITPEEYLRMERASEERHEYFRGEVFAMSGASREHNLISANTNRHIGAQLDERPCELYQSDMRVKVSPTGLYTYPDIVISCGTPEFEDRELDTLLNPTVIIEVLSGSTEKYDRGKKFKHYRNISTLKEYLLIAQDTIHVEQFANQSGQWIYTDANSLDDVLTLSSIECTLALSSIYKKVTFKPEQGLHS